MPVPGEGQLEEQVQVLKPAHYIMCRVPVQGAGQLGEQLQVPKHEACSRVPGSETRNGTGTTVFFF